MPAHLRTPESMFGQREGMGEEADVSAPVCQSLGEREKERHTCEKGRQRQNKGNQVNLRDVHRFHKLEDLFFV